MSQFDVPLVRSQFAQTSRRDNWWVQPLAVFLGLSVFIVYSTWAALQGQHYRFGPYLSPFYSPELFGDPVQSWFGARPGWIPAWVTAAMLILWAPGGFRVTCYYYRGAYYKAFWADPVACAVGESRKSFLGERYFPLILQNIHRYFFYLAALFIVILSYDAFMAMWFTDEAGKNHFGIGLGTIVLILNPIFLGLYTFGCHSFRHLIGGFLDSKSKAPTCAKAYNCVTCLNVRHMLWAWVSLFWVGFTDVYVRLCATGCIHDIKII